MKNHRLFTYAILALLGISLTWFMRWALEKGLGDLVERPLYSSIWGTVSDWIMIIVTATTGFLIWMTLKSQLESHKLLRQQLLQEQDNHLEKIKPHFDIHDNGTNWVVMENDKAIPESEWDKLTLRMAFTINNSGGLAKDISVKSVLAKTILGVHLDIIDKFSETEGNVGDIPTNRSGTFHLEGSVQWVDIKTAYVFDIEIYFQDRLGSEYTQIIKLKFTMINFPPPPHDKWLLEDGRTPPFDIVSQSYYVIHPTTLIRSYWA